MCKKNLFAIPKLLTWIVAEEKILLVTQCFKILVYYLQENNTCPDISLYMYVVLPPPHKLLLSFKCEVQIRLQYRHWQVQALVGTAVNIIVLQSYDASVKVILNVFGTNTVCLWSQYIHMAVITCMTVQRTMQFALVVMSC